MRVVLLKGFPLDLGLEDAALDLVDLRRHGVDFHLELRGRLVDQVDGLVGEEAVGDVAVGQRRGRDERRVGDLHAVMDLVTLRESAENRDRVLDGRLPDEHGLEATLERGVLLDALPILADRGRADCAQIPAGERRLQHVAGVHRALGGARAHERVQLVDEENDLSVGLLDFLQDGLEALLELAAKLRAGDHRAEVERDDALVLQRLGHVAGGDAAGEALDDGRLADAGVADEDRVVLRAPRQHLHHAADLLVAADDRIELALSGELGEVLRVALEGLVLLLGVRVGHAARTAHVLEGGEKRGLRKATGEEGLRGPGLPVAQESEEEVLARDVVVFELSRDFLGEVDQLHEGRREPRFRPLAPYPRQLRELLFNVLPRKPRSNADPLEERGHDALVLKEQRLRQVLRRGFRMPFGPSGLGRLLKGFLGLVGKTLDVHRRKYRICL